MRNFGKVKPTFNTYFAPMCHNLMCTFQKKSFGDTFRTPAKAPGPLQHREAGSLEEDPALPHRACGSPLPLVGSALGVPGPSAPLWAQQRGRNGGFSCRSPWCGQAGACRRHAQPAWLALYRSSVCPEKNSKDFKDSKSKEKRDTTF